MKIKYFACGHFYDIDTDGENVEHLYNMLVSMFPRLKFVLTNY